MKLVCNAVRMIGICLVLFVGIAHADDESVRDRRFEANLSFEQLKPHDVYGTWKNLTVDYHHRLNRGLAYYIQVGAFSRNEGDAALGAVGAYKDWSSRLYTYSALSAATNSDYLPRFRADNDLNIKLGEKKALVWLLGVSYINYFVDHEDLILSTGITYYRDKWIVSYRLFRNDSSPGDVVSYSSLVNVGYGSEGKQWTFLDVSTGKQAYLATNLPSPDEVRQNAFYINLKHRRWIGNGYGVILGAGFFRLDEGYKKYSISPGFFREF